MNLLKGPFVLKIAALFMALIVYFYIHNELLREKANPIIDQSYRLLKPTARSLPVKVRVATEPPDGYKIDEGLVAANPAHIVVIGPEALFEEGATAETALVDVSESTKTTTKRIPLESVAGTHLAGEPYFVEITIPIQKIETSASEQ